MSRASFLLLICLVCPLCTFADTITELMGSKTIYVKDDIDLKGRKFVLPSNGLLVFQGGTIRNGTLVGNCSDINAGSYTIFKNVVLEGSWNVAQSYPEWMGCEANSRLDCSEAINKVVDITSGKVSFTRGCYYITQPIHTYKANVEIDNNDTIRAMSPMEYMVLLDSHDNGVMTLRTHARIYGGGVLDGNQKAKIGVTLRKCLRAQVSEITICNTLKYGFQAALNSTEAGNSVLSNVVFLNPHSVDDAIAINNNRADCTYQNIGIVNYRTAVISSGTNAKFTNVQPWIVNSSFWQNSVAFDCYSPYIIMYGCGADTMRKFIKCHSDYFFASVVNCAAFKNDKVVSDALAMKYPPVIIDKNNTKYSQIQMVGGVYWYNIPYKIFSDVSQSDQILINRYNSLKANLKSNVANTSDK